MTKHDIENSAAATAESPTEFKPNELGQATWFNYNSWTHHAQQWLKGGAMVLGTAAFGGLTYLTGSGLRRNNAATNEDVANDIGGAITLKNDGISALATAMRPASFTGRELLSLSEVDAKPSSSKVNALNELSTSNSLAKPITSQLQLTKKIKTSDLELDYPEEAHKNQNSEREVHESGAAIVNTYTVGSQSNPIVASFSNSKYVIAWGSYGQVEGMYTDVYGQIYTSGHTKQGTEFRVNTYSSFDQGGPVIAALSDGGFASAWGSSLQDGGNAGVYCQRYDSNGGKNGGEFRVNTYTADYQALPAIAGLSGGGFVVAWQSYHQDGGGAYDGYAVYGQRYNSAGVAQGSEFRINTSILGDQYNRGIVGLANGGFVVTWESTPLGGYGISGIYIQRYDSNSLAQGSEELVTTTNAANGEGQSKIVALPNNKFVIIWNGASTFGDVYGQLYASDGTKQGSAFLVNTYTDNTQRNLAITSLSTGNFIIMWQTDAHPGYPAESYGYCYDSNGVFKDSFYVSGDNAMVPTSIAGLENGFVVVYDSTDGDSGGIKVKSLNIIPTFINKTLFVAEGESVIITPSMIKTQDVDTKDTDLIFTVSNVQYGQFEFVSNSAITTTFTQQKIIDGQVRFVHDGGENAPAFNIAVSDGVSTSTTQPASISFTHINDAPVLNTNGHPILPSISEDDLSPNGDLISAIVVPGSITDIDSSTGAIAITEADNAHGAWQYSLDNITWLPIAPVSISSSLLLDSANKIRFVPNPDFDGNATFTFRAWDKTSGSIGAKVNTTVNGGNTAFSTATNTATITVININDAPVLSSSVHPQLTAITEDTTAPNGDTASFIISGLVTDPDSPLGPMVVTEVDNTYGSWQYKLDSTLWKPIAPVTDVSGLLLDAHHKVRFVPNAEFSGDSSFTFRAWDKTTGVAGTKVDTTVNGGTTAFSSESNFAMVTVTSVNDLPILENNQLAINQGQSVVLTSARLKATDVDDDVTKLQFVISELTHGKFAVVNNTEIGLTTFLQQQITDEEILFIHDNSDKTPSYKVAVSDGVGTTQPEAAAIDFKAASTNTKTIVDNSKTASRSDTIKNAIIGAGISGGVGLMFLVLKIYLGHKASQKLEKSAAEYKDSVQKKQEDFERNVLQPVAKKIRKEMKITGFMGYISDATVNDYIAAVVRLIRELKHQGVNVDLSTMDSVEQSMLLTEIAKQTRHLLVPKHGMCSCAPVITFFKPEVKPEDIHKNAKNIAKEVKKALTRQDTEFSLKETVELDEVNHDSSSQVKVASIV